MVKRKMKFDRKFSAAFLIGGLLLGLAAPAVAHQHRHRTTQKFKRRRKLPQTVRV
jgi:CHASE1-domain containing sensor protein